MPKYVRHPSPHADGPYMDNFLTVVIICQVSGLCYGLASSGIWNLIEYLFYGVVSLVIGEFVRSFFKWLGPRIAVKTHAVKTRNMRKFADQAWHLVIHTSMTIAEVYLLARPSVNWRWWTEMDSGDVQTTWEPVDQSLDAPVRSFYLLQLALWSFTAINHRFHESRHLDYFVMLSHHVATLSLLMLSWWAEPLRVGVLVLLLHDSSDIIADLLKSFNYLGYGANSGTYLSEMFFVGNLVSWGYTRLYLFPFHLIKSTFTDLHYFTAGERGTNQLFFKCYCCIFFLCAVCAMSGWWFCLFIRMGYRLLTQTPDDVARETYEGDSDVDSGNEDGAQVEKPKKKKKTKKLN